MVNKAIILIDNIFPLGYNDFNNPKGASPMLLANINEVVKASPAIQIQSKITHLQRRAWNVLLANAYNELTNKEIH